MSAITLLGALLVAVGMFVAVRGARRTTEPDLIEQRLASYTTSTQALTLEQIELQQPFVDRFVRPAMERIGSLLSRRTPQARRSQVLHRLQLAGRPGGLDVDSFMAMKLGFAAGLGIVLFLLLPLIGLGLPINLLGLIGGALLGFYLPEFWLNSKVRARKKEILLSLPNVLDLLTVAVEAGLSFDAALVRVTEKFKNALSQEFGQVLQEVRLGRPRLEALDDMGRRAGVEELHNFVQALIQSEQLGVGIARILRIQSEEMRRKRRQRAEEKAAQATLKMMIPMVGCIFPTLFIVLLGPAAVALKHSFVDHH
jgi:tight adherence protein C